MTAPSEEIQISSSHELEPLVRLVDELHAQTEAMHREAIAEVRDLEELVSELKEVNRQMNARRALVSRTGGEEA